MQRALLLAISVGAVSILGCSGGGGTDGGTTDSGTRAPVDAGQPVDAGDPRYSVQVTGSMAIADMSAIVASNARSLSDGGYEIDPNVAYVIMAPTTREHLCDFLSNETSEGYDRKGAMYFIGVIADGGIVPGSYPYPGVETGSASALALFPYVHVAHVVDGGVTVKSFSPPSQLIGFEYSGGAMSLDFSLTFVDSQGLTGTLSGSASATGCPAYQLLYGLF